ncbi:hypothetical protein PIB30_088932 [Stylosanthes scabra]|uniref:Uncharacterized protein n=1 Tax=Stylosanthes scabra TaxID=79078 RepID=A0ABU6SVE9_9FABA|nr:hypothetical protein [Stylosanthes scabra]
MEYYIDYPVHTLTNNKDPVLSSTTALTTPDQSRELEVQTSSQTNVQQPVTTTTSIPISRIEIVLPPPTAADPAPQIQPQNTHQMLTRSKTGNIKPTTLISVSVQDPDFKYTLPKSASQALKFPH